jgi:DNA polymerase
MREVALESEIDFAGWRAAARALLVADVPPEEVIWRVGADAGLFAGGETPKAPPVGVTGSVPRRFIEAAELGALHSDPERFALLYRLLWRLRDEPLLMELASDPDVARLNGLVKAVARDIHKMHAFVRFRRVETGNGEQFVAWHEPDHHIVEAAAPFFMRRFNSMAWTILTPECVADWDGETLRFGPGAARKDAPEGDDLEELWRGYYASSFNPARLNLSMMKKEMPVRFWKNLPEAALIRQLTEDAARRTDAMVETIPKKPVARRGKAVHDAAAALPDVDETTLEGVREAARRCRACPLWEPATQTVFGEGPEGARVMFVGEQPGDQEELAGKPFVGPAGQLFDKALAEAGIDRGIVYVTNAVKHFKFEPRGKRRIHAKPNQMEIHACAPWLGRELDLVKPDLVVMLGATAANSVMNHKGTLKSVRGRVVDLPDGRKGFVTVHPSSILRVPPELKAEAYREFLADLRAIADLLGP